MISATQYFSEQDFTLRYVRFEYQNAVFVGQGILTWDPDEGVHIDALVEAKTPRTEPVVFGGMRIRRQEDRTHIRMRPATGSGWIVAQNVYLVDRFDIALDNRLSTYLPSVIFSEPIAAPSGSTRRGGRALLGELPGRPTFPDSVREERRLEDGFGRESRSRSGLLIDEKDISLRGMKDDTGVLELSWALEASEWTRAQQWEGAEALRISLGILMGKDVELLWRRVQRPSHRYTEIRKGRKPRQLGALAPFRDKTFLDKEALIEFARFFLRDSPEAQVARHLFGRLVQSVDQPHLDISAFLMSSTLEAALRTLQKKPYIPNEKDRWSPISSLRWFAQEYLSPEWDPWLEQIHEAWKRLRHRTAHPDWTFTAHDPSSEEDAEAALKDMLMLARFYGFMVLALAQVGDLTPDFSAEVIR